MNLNILELQFLFNCIHTAGSKLAGGPDQNSFILSFIVPSCFDEVQGH
jgi:hypothetical protein